MNRSNNLNFLVAGIEKKYDSTDLKDSGVPDKLSPSYTKIHVDKDTGPDYCYTAIGNNKHLLANSTLIIFLMRESMLIIIALLLKVYLNTGNCVDFCGGNLVFDSGYDSPSENENFVKRQHEPTSRKVKQHFNLDMVFPIPTKLRFIFMTICFNYFESR